MSTTSDEDAIRSVLDVLTMPVDAPTVQDLDPGLSTAVRNTQSWIYGPGVVGYGLAQKSAGGVADAALALKIYVAQKKPLSQLADEHRVPPSVGIPGIAGEVLTDVEALGEQRLEPLAERLRPAVPGYSLGPLGGHTGTLGALVRHSGDPHQLLILSNSHVLAASGTAQAGLAIVQPGPDDGGTETDLVAHLEKWAPFDFGTGFNNLCDAAVATVVDAASVTAAIYDIGLPKGINAKLERGMTVQKSGRTTAHTTGLVKDVDYRTYMPYPKPDGGFGDAGFRSQVLCERYTDGGDSGALVCDTGGQAVGLHWCGSDSASIFSPIGPVLSALDLELVLAQ